MSRYTQDNVPEEILNRFPTLRNRPPSVSRVPSQTQPIQQSQSNSHQESNNNQSQKDNHNHDNTNSNANPNPNPNSNDILEELKKKFPELSNIQNQRIIERPQFQQSLIQSQQPLILSVRSLNKEFAPETLPLKEQIVINKANCSLCPNHKKTQSGLLNDLPISHQSPTKKKF